MRKLNPEVYRLNPELLEAARIVGLQKSSLINLGKCSNSLKFVITFKAEDQSGSPFLWKHSRKYKVWTGKLVRRFGAWYSNHLLC